MILFAVIIIGFTSVLIFHTNCHSTVRPLHFKIILYFPLITFISSKIKGLLNQYMFVSYYLRL